MTTDLGRPRDPRIDSAVLRSTVDLLGETGYAELSVDAIARRAGTSKPAIYRRWPSKAHLVHEAVFPLSDATELPDTGSLAGDVREMVRRTVTVLTTPAARAALPGLVGEMAADLGRRPLTRVGDRHPGVGLGLAVAKGFAEAMGGRIVAKDTPGGGLTVQIALPAASSDKSALGAGS